MFPAATLWRKGNHVNVSRDQSALAKGEKPILELYKCILINVLNWILTLKNHVR